MLRRFIPARLWPALRWALVTSAILTAFAVPLIRGYGRDPTIPSLLNRHYGGGLGAYLVAVWVVAAVFVAARLRRRNR